MRGIPTWEPLRSASTFLRVSETTQVNYCLSSILDNRNMNATKWTFLDTKPQLTEAVGYRCSVKKSVLRHFAEFTKNHMCQSLFFNEVAGLRNSRNSQESTCARISLLIKLPESFSNKVVSLRPAISLKKRLWHRCFPLNFGKFPRTPFPTEHLWRRLLKWI